MSEMSDKYLEDLQSKLKDATACGVGIAKALVDDLITQRKANEHLRRDLIAVTNCGFCSLCQERHGRKS